MWLLLGACVRPCLTVVHSANPWGYRTTAAAVCSMTGPAHVLYSSPATAAAAAAAEQHLLFREDSVAGHK